MVNSTISIFEKELMNNVLFDTNLLIFKACRGKLKFIFMVVLLFSLVLKSNSHSQSNNIFVGANIGVYAYNSENNNSVTEESYAFSDLVLIYGANIGLLENKLLPNELIVELQWKQSKPFEKMEIETTTLTSGGKTNEFDLSLTTFSLNLAYELDLGSSMNIAVGPTLAMFLRTISSENTEWWDFEDRLNSFGLGANIYFYIKSSNYLIGLKSIYTHSLIYDNEHRDLSNYSQDFLSVELFVNYCFEF